MRIETSRQGSTVVLKLHGFLAGADAEAIREHLGTLPQSDAAGVALDVSGVLFVDSRGLETLVEAAEQAIRDGRTLRLLGQNPKFYEILDLTELTSLFEMAPQAEAAVEKGR